MAMTVSPGGRLATGRRAGYDPPSAPTLNSPTAQSASRAMTHQDTPRCPDCQGIMEVGFLPEITNNNLTGMTTWHPGEPHPQTFLGFKTGMIKVDWKQVHPVSTYRCPRCGLLRSYAHLKPEGA
jgi:hypothetical protein